MTARFIPASGATASGATGHRHQAAATTSREGHPHWCQASTLAPRERKHHMSTTQSPRGVPGGQHDNCGGTRVLSIVPTPADSGAEEQQRARWHTERERREDAITAIREQLKQQPSPHAVRACGRRWNTLITQLADDVASAMSSTEPTE